MAVRPLFNFVRWLFIVYSPLLPVHPLDLGKRPLRCAPFKFIFLHSFATCIFLVWESGHCGAPPFQISLFRIVSWCVGYLLFVLRRDCDHCGAPSSLDSPGPTLYLLVHLGIG